MSQGGASRTRAVMWSLIVGVVLVCAGALLATTWPTEVRLGAPAELWDNTVPAPAATADPGVTDARSDTWRSLNDALRDHDRAAFLEHTTGAATAQLAQWWDNTTLIGWEVAAVTPWDDATIVLGAELGFAAHPERGSGSPDGGLHLVHGFFYAVTWQGDLLASVTPLHTPMPWDEGPIQVSRTEHVVVVGDVSEAALVQATAADAELAAQRALDFVAELGGQSPVDGFVLAVTDDPDRLARWQFGNGAGWGIDVSGFAVPTVRPPVAAPWIDPIVATGDTTSAAVVALGPLSASNRVPTAVHEFLHAVHYTAAPRSGSASTLGTEEGFAEWGETVAGGLTPAWTRPEVVAAVRAAGTAAFSDEALRGADAWIAYAAAASFYAFVHASGSDAWQLAITAERTGDPLVDVAQSIDPALTEPAWQSWLAAQ